MRKCDPVGAVEIAARLGVARRTVDAWRQRDLGFPEPRWQVGGRPAWNWDDVTEWTKANRPDLQPESNDPDRITTTDAVQTINDGNGRPDVPVALTGLFGDLVRYREAECAVCDHTRALHGTGSPDISCSVAGCPCKEFWP